ncbi:hypothetical protein EP331_07085 [bacterium]|nr:MAG: hypothetical protein EP331_07085 [bacterium]
MSKLEARKKELQEQVDDLEGDINERINSVKAKVQATLSVQKWVEDYPLPSVGAAIIAGFVLAYKSGSPKKKSESQTSTSSDIKSLILAEVKKQVMKKVMEKISERFS